MIETERLLFRKFTLDDLDLLYKFRSDENITQYLGGIASREDVEARLRWYIGCYDKCGFGYCLMSGRENGEPIGWAGLQPLEDTGLIEVGYGMEKEYWGRGLGTEACRGWLGFGFNTAGLSDISAIAIPENKASRRIMEKSGLTYQKNIQARGFECALYRITKDEFARIK